MKAEPCSGVPMPLDVEAVGADPVETGEGGVELLSAILREPRAVALDELILSAVPFAEDICQIASKRDPSIACNTDPLARRRTQSFGDGGW